MSDEFSCGQGVCCGGRGRAVQKETSEGLGCETPFQQDPCAAVSTSSSVRLPGLQISVPPWLSVQRSVTQRCQRLSEQGPELGQPRGGEACGKVTCGCRSVR